MPDYYQYAREEGVWLGFKKLTETDLKKILLKLSCTRREVRPRKCRRLEGLAEILNKLPPSKPPVNFNVVGNKAIGDAGMKHLHLIPDSVSSLDVSDCGLTPAGVKTVCDFMKDNTRISRLVMWGNDIGDQGAKHIAGMLKENKTLQILYASSANIGEEGFREISKALCENDTLRDIDISTNEVGDSHVMALCVPGLLLNEGVETLDLACTNLTESGLDWLRLVLEFGNVHLKDIKLSRETCDGNHYISNRAWFKVLWWLNFNCCDRWVIHDEKATPGDWMNALIKSSQSNVVDFSYKLLLAKPELCIRN